MPNTCVLDIGLNGLEQDAVGLPARLQIYARVQGTCSRVRFTLRLSQGGPVLFSGEAVPDSNGTCSVDFPIEPPTFPCGFSFWVEAQCIAGGTCSTAASLPIQCKRPGSQGPGGPGGPGTGNGNGSGNGWQLPSFCILMGQAFLMALYAGLLLLVTSVAFGQPGGMVAAGALIVGALALRAIWLTWCSVSFCHFWGAVLWVLKHAVLAGAILSVLTVSAAGVLLTLFLGAIAGMITAQLRYNRCPLPPITTPIQQLPLT